MTFPINSNQTNPTGASALFQPQAQVPTPPAGQTATIPVDQTTLSPAATAVSVPQVPMQPASTGGLGGLLNGMFDLIGKLFSGLFGFVRRLFNANPAGQAPLPPASQTVPPTGTVATTPTFPVTPVPPTTGTTTPAPTTPAPTTDPTATTTPVVTTPAPTTTPTTTPTTPAPTTDPATATQPPVVTVPVSGTDTTATTPTTTTTTPAPTTNTTTPAPTTPTTPTTTPTTGTPPATGTLSPEELQMCQQQGLLATRENFDAFMKEAQALEAQNALGPGSTETDSINELQQLLAGWGYPVQATGQFDQATIDAVVKFKKDNNLTATYKMADGTQAVHPFVDDATKQAMIAKLQGSTPAPTTPTTPPTDTTPAPTTGTPTPTTPAPTPGTTQYQATPLTAEETQMAQQQGILATRENFDAFMKEAQGLEAQNALGPGSTDKDAITELQQVLAGFGYAVQATGTFDQATTDAVIKFKKDNNVTSTYKMADGSPGVHPFIDDATKQVMLTKLGQAAPTTPTTTTPPATTTPAPAPTTPGTTQYQASPLSADEAQIAQQQGILATRDNFDAFMKEAQALEAQNAVGPGSTDKDAITELQQLLAGWGYPVQATGAFDQATADAVVKFKRDNNLTATYKMADGTPAVHPFVDDATKQAMLAKLGQAPAPTTPTVGTNQYQAAPTTGAPPVVTVSVNGQPTTPTPAPTTGTNQYQAVGLSAAQQEIANDNGLLPTAENVTAFMAEANALQAQIPVGPGSVDTQAITELQQLLNGWGYPVSATGQFDAATEAAVLKFKRDNNLFASYKLADGTQAIHPYIDEATKQVMLKKLNG